MPRVLLQSQSPLFRFQVYPNLSRSEVHSGRPRLAPRGANPFIQLGF